MLSCLGLCQMTSTRWGDPSRRRIPRLARNSVVEILPACFPIFVGAFREALHSGLCLDCDVCRKRTGRSFIFKGSWLTADDGVGYVFQLNCWQRGDCEGQAARQRAGMGSSTPGQKRDARAAMNKLSSGGFASVRPFDIAKEMLRAGQSCPKPSSLRGLH